MRGWVWAIGAGLLVLAGCGGEPAAAPEPAVTTGIPVSNVGGVCDLLDVPTIAEVTGTQFVISATSRHRRTRTCVMQTDVASRPDLSLSVTPTTADAEIFAAEMRPRGAKTVAKLGKSAYWLTLTGRRGNGAEVEVGWLSRTKRLMCLRYRFAPGTDTAAAKEFAPKIIALAKKIEAVKT